MARQPTRSGTEAGDAAYLRYHWGAVYTIVQPAYRDDTWKAVAKFGAHDVLAAENGYELLELVRRHYPGNVGGIRRLG
jgi:hypothetical protein